METKILCQVSTFVAIFCFVHSISSGSLVGNFKDQKDELDRSVNGLIEELNKTVTQMNLKANQLRRNYGADTNTKSIDKCVLLVDNYLNQIQSEFSEISLKYSNFRDEYSRINETDPSALQLLSKSKMQFSAGSNIIQRFEKEKKLRFQSMNDEAVRCFIDAGANRQII